MARNLKKEYIKKMINTVAPNGYKFDLMNYLYNPALENDYPAFRKIIDEDEETYTVRRVYYFKYWNGTGEYIDEIYTVKKNNDDSKWVVVDVKSKNILKQSNRFNLNQLLTFC